MTVGNNKIDSNYIKNALSCNPFEILNKILATDSGKIAYKRTAHVLKIALAVYIPLVILWLVTFIQFNYLALPGLLILLLSPFAFTKYVLIPLSENKRKEIEKEVRG